MHANHRKMYNQRNYNWCRVVPQPQRQSRYTTYHPKGVNWLQSVPPTTFQGVNHPPLSTNHSNNVGNHLKRQLTSYPPTQTCKEEIKYNAEPQPKRSKSTVEPNIKESKAEIPKEVESAVDISLETGKVPKGRNESLLGQLYPGKQCTSCEIRFTKDQSKEYSEHLDWHFRENRKNREAKNRIQSRGWYLPLNEWCEKLVQEGTDQSNFFKAQKDAAVEKKLENSILNKDKVAFSLKASKYEGAKCTECLEDFSTYFDHELEEWRLRDAMLDKSDGHTYHPICHETR